MMLVLALRSDAPRVYEQALQLLHARRDRRGVRRHPRRREPDAAAVADEAARARTCCREFRELAPPRPPIRIQRWSVRRVVLTLWVLLLAFLAVGLVVSNWNAFA